MQKENVGNPDMVTREQRTSVGAMDAAKLKMRAIRRSTVQRQGSSINLQKIVEHVHDEVPNKLDEENSDDVASS